MSKRRLEALDDRNIAKGLYGSGEKCKTCGQIGGHLRNCSRLGLLNIFSYGKCKYCNTFRGHTGTCTRPK